MLEANIRRIDKTKKMTEMTEMTKKTIFLYHLNVDIDTNFRKGKK